MKNTSRTDRFDEIIEQFTEQFGEEHVDVQYRYPVWQVIVWFPTVTIENEHGNTVTINDLYVKTEINSNGNISGTPQMMRPVVPVSHYISGYAHSHLPRRAFCEWRNACLGSGPLINTRATLACKNNVEIWGLYVYELSKYVTVESIEGVPHIKMSEIGKKRVNPYVQLETASQDVGDMLYEDRYILDMFTYYLANKCWFKFAYTKGRVYVENTTTKDYIELNIEFAKFMNKCVADGDIRINEASTIIEHCTKMGIHDGQYFYTSTNGDNLLNVQEKQVLTFKGRPVKFEIIPDDDSQDNTAQAQRILCPHAVTYIYHKVNTIANIYNFSHEKERGITSNFIRTEYII